MKQEVIAIYDIGKTNKKVILFDRNLEVVHEEEEIFEEITDEDGFACDDIEKIERWILRSIQSLASSEKYTIKGVNFSTYGATLIYLDGEGRRIGPAYNYLKPMPTEVLEGFYQQHGGEEAFSRCTASPTMGMLNAGLQILFVKNCKPHIYKQTQKILHLPQYLSYLLTNEITSEYTSIGCHTAMWDFDQNQYHPWLKEEDIELPQPTSNKSTFSVTIQDKKILVGTGLHDSSASLIPYLLDDPQPFILLSTGTWCIAMNPFNEEPLTFDQLRQDTLCYMSINQKQVKSSRVFLGHIHDVNMQRLVQHFQVQPVAYKTIPYNPQIIAALNEHWGDGSFFFKEGIPGNYIDTQVDLSSFDSFEQAYHMLMKDLAQMVLQSIELITSHEDTTKNLYLCGGFNRNEILVQLLKQWLPNKTIIPSRIKNATALGAAMIIREKVFF